MAGSDAQIRGEKTQTEQEHKDWLIEDFPVDLRWRCKRAASHRRTPLKKFVQDVMKKAVEEAEAEMLHSTNEGRKEEVRRSSAPTDSSVPREPDRDKAGKKKT
jgi:hypothetical protein